MSGKGLDNFGERAFAGVSSSCFVLLHDENTGWLVRNAANGLWICWSRARWSPGAVIRSSPLKKVSYTKVRDAIEGQGR
jgi:hypothetical protein